MRIFFSIISFLIILSSCQKKSEDSILAKVYEYTLFYDDVIYNLPSNISDTNSYLNKYVDDWVSKKVLLNQAYINIDDNTDELEKKVSVSLSALRDFKSTASRPLIKIELSDFVSKDFIKHSIVFMFKSEFLQTILFMDLNL